MENAQTERPAERLIRIGKVKDLTGLSTATLYRKISAREFPRPVQLGAAARAWLLSEVQDWIAGRIALRDTDEHGASTSALVSDVTEERRLNPETPRPRCRIVQKANRRPK
jgi:prophage regulatory protein